LDSPSVLVLLPATTQWEGLIHPFPNHSVEFGIARAFSRAFQQSTTSAYSGLFYKRSKKRKGVGSKRGFYLEPFRRQKGALFGSLAANTYLVYCHAPTQLPQEGIDSYMRNLEAPPATTSQSITLVLVVPTTSNTHATSTPTTRVASAPIVATIFRPISRLEVDIPEFSIDLTTATTSHGASTSTSLVIDLTISMDNGNQDDHFNYLLDEWVKAEEAYYTALRRRSLHVPEVTYHGANDTQKSTTFWLAFGELEKAVLFDPKAQPNVLQTITRTLVICRDNKKDLACYESDLMKITEHPAISMYSAADIRQQFELAARPFWQEWDEYERILNLLPGNSPCKEFGLLLLETYGEQGQDHIDELEELFKLSSNKFFSKSLLQLMCKSNSTTIDLEEDELFHRRKAVEAALLEFQSYFLKRTVFHSFKLFLDSSTSVP
jgi:hypothetical protein